MYSKTFSSFLLLFCAVLLLTTGCQGGDPESSSSALPDSISASTAASQAGSTQAVPAVKAYFAEDILEVPDKIMIFTDPEIDDEFFSHVALLTDDSIRDIYYFTLTYNEKGGLAAGEIITTVPSLSQNELLQFDFTFYDMPSRGIAYTSSDGLMHTCYFSQSGKDGSLIFEEFDPAVDTPFGAE